MKSVVLAAVIVVALSACATTHMDASARPYTGYWYGENQFSDNDARKWVIARHYDGTYWASFECLRSINCQPYKAHGVWGVDGNVYWVKTMLLIDESGPFYPDNSGKVYFEQYQITDFSNDEFEYRHIDSKQVYRSYRVSKEFASEFDKA
ncbi:MAG: hypothetical protein COB61_010020 [Thiotrichales bacterium]|nr:hypothetical protein [Thiotrichales bacterium]